MGSRTMPEGSKDRREETGVVRYAIRVEELTKYYGKTRGIDHLNLAVEQGDFFGFMKEYGLDRILTDPADAGPYISDRFMASDKKTKDAISDLLKYVKEFVDKGLIQIDDNTIIVTKERLEEFRATVKERYDSYKSFYNKNTNKFEPLKECTNCYCKDMCTIYGQRGDVNE